MMLLSKQRVLLAELCGWTALRWDLHDSTKLLGTKCFGVVGWEELEVEDYHHDLNAMYNAEKALWHRSTKLFDDYIRAIYAAVDARTTNGEVGLEVLDPFDVTTVLWRYADAPTRAEAMYSTLVNQSTE